jgi:hypothetical protein
MPVFTNSVIAGLTRNLLIVFGIWGLRVKPAMTLLINAYSSDITLWRGQGEVEIFDFQDIIISFLHLKIIFR